MFASPRSKAEPVALSQGSYLVHQRVEYVGIIAFGCARRAAQR
jgi:hypothetical protein